MSNKILNRKEFLERESHEYYLPQQKINFIKDSFKEKIPRNQLDLNELKRALNKYSINFNEKELLGRLLKNAEENGSSQIDFAQFIDGITTKLSEIYEEKDLAKFFSLFIGDDNTDKIEYEHLRKIINDLKDDEIEEMIQKADIDKDGKINFEEFVNIINKKV